MFIHFIISIPDLGFGFFYPGSGFATLAASVWLSAWHFLIQRLPVLPGQLFGAIETVA
jgi:hypothetical protein